MNENDQLLNQNNEHLKKLHEIVKKTLQEEELIIDNLLHPPKEILSQGQRISDKVARFGGSWNFIISFTVVLAIWILYNAVVPAPDRFDPFPFILMNLVLSCIAALQAPIIMMSQNRQEEKDRMRSENDYLINLKAELEIRSLHQKLDLLLEDQIKELYESQAKQLNLLENLQSRVETLCERAK
jgi:uncharacterized membrane protein